MEGSIFERLVSQLIATGGRLPAELRAALEGLPEPDQAAVRALGHRLAVSGPGVGSLPTQSAPNTWS